MLLLCVERYEDSVTQPSVEGLGQVALARRVLHENDFTRADLARLAVARGDLHAGIEVDDVLAARRGMPVEIVVGLDLAEDDARRRQALGRLARPAALGDLDFDVTEMRLALRVDVEIVDSHARPPGCGAGFYQRLLRRPPSTLSETPVMKLARSEQRNATASASSSGRPQRPSAFFR